MDKRSMSAHLMATRAPVSRVPLDTGEAPQMKLALLALTFSTGLVDAASFLGLGRIFIANMTGNILFVGFSLGGAPGLTFSGQITSLLAFATGATLGGRFIRASGEAPRSWLLTTAVVEAVLLFAACIITLAARAPLAWPSVSFFSVIALAALALGWRTAVVRRLAVPDLPTTVLTWTLVGLASESTPAGGNNPRFGRRLVTLSSLFAGAIAGALLVRWGLAAPLAGCAVCAALAASACASLPSAVQAGG